MASAAPSITPLLTEKRVARLEELPLVAGGSMRDVAIGYETYGCLNPARDNVVLVCHFFSGTSHAAGRYHGDDPEPGWWDAVIGPGKAIDTDRYFVVAMDALGCIRLDAPHGVTTSAYSIDPETRRAYGPDFPVLHIRDVVRSQRMVLDQLGIGRLAMVAGPSLGAMQALTWATSYPEDVDRVVAAIGLPDFQAREMGLYRIMTDAIQLDPRYQGGRYDPDLPPVEGVGLALKLLLLLSSGREGLKVAFGRRAADPSRDPRVDPQARYAIEAYLDEQGRLRSPLVDANAFVAMLRINMNWDLGEEFGSMVEAMRRVKARVLLVPGLGDELAHGPSYHDPLVEALEEAGVEHAVMELPSRYGHLAGLADIGKAAEAIRACLEGPTSP